ncbi:rifampicin phosphotransferase-like isoform X2 [Calliopsis andreniformis]|uniref:rifampicin phosphotransferase-like isoform X2 n=1 Tax=Calliopsis andreniformis TaxID=337506 RepID=UPI003FCDF0C6
MEDILFIAKIVFSIFLPLWLYYCFTTIINKRSNSKHDVPNFRFLLKRWWAECSILMKRKERVNLHNHKKNYLENSSIRDKNSSNSLLFFATDKRGNSVFVKFSQRGFKTVEVSLRLTTSEGQLYVLPAYPDTTLMNSFNQEWTAGGIKIELLESQKRWRIIYNGMLRNLADGDECSDRNIEHIRLNLLFIANSEPLKWPDNWSSRLHAEALASEPWRSPEWLNKIKLLEYVGFDQFGSMLGQITYKNGLVSTLYLRGLHQHRWGKHESHEFHESVTLYGIMPCGAIYYLNTSSTKHSFPQILYGQFRDNNEIVRKIDKIEIKLPNFTQKKFDDSLVCKISFTVAGTEYNIFAKGIHPTTLYYGQPWNWKNTIATAELELNGKSDKTNYVVHFDDARCQNENIVGGKGFSLAVLTSVKDADFIIPRGFCVTIFALDLQLHSHKKLQKAINDIEDVSVGKKDGDLEKYCDEAVSIIQSTSVVDDVKIAILKAIKILEQENSNDKSIKYAIRSSAVGEDNEETSAAGQNSTYLAVEGMDNIIKHIAMCWASLFSYQSVKYRKEHGLFIKSSMGVCVQKMVNADAAGVMFTRHPTTGDPSNIVITSNYGLGETVVSAAVEPDTIVIHKSWNNKLTVENVIRGNKKQKMSVGDDGLITTELKNDENETISISEQIALQLATIGLNLETLFNSARDVEWAVVDEKIYLLQARPITTLYSWTEYELMHELGTGVPSDIDLITFANVGEVFPYPMSPLNISIMLKAFNKAVAHIYNHEHEYFLVVGNRAAINYYNMFLRDPRKEIIILNKVVDLALCGNIIITPEIHRIALERNGEAGFHRRIFLIYNMLMEMIRNSSMEKIARETCQNLILNPEDFHTAYSLYNEINQKHPEYLKITECHMYTSRVGITYQILTMIFLTKGYKDFEPEHFSDIALLLGSCTDVVGAELLTWLEKIVKYINKSEKGEEFRKMDPTKAIDWLKINCPLAGKELQNLLQEQGHRCIQELDFLAEPWSLKPENLIITLQLLTATPEVNKMKKLLSVEETIASLKTPKSAVTKWFLRKLIPHCRKAVVRREITKSLFAKVVHKFRLAYKKLGKLMVLEEYLPNEDLVFFLTNEEIGEVLNHRKATLVQKACRRKKLFPRLNELRYQELNTGMPIPIKNVLDTIITDEHVKIQGLPVCGGSALNRACVITEFADTHKIQQGDILITYATDIAWSPYFPLLSGIVTELGGLISHGAVVAREYGLPCIIGAKRATEMFQTGDTVLLVADTGILQLVKKHDQEAIVEKSSE